MSLGEGRKGHVRLRVSYNQNHRGPRVHVIFEERDWCIMCQAGEGRCDGSEAEGSSR